MGGSISSIVDLAILTHSITVRVTVDVGTGWWTSDMYCAAFPTPTGGASFNWGQYHTVSRHLPNSDGSYVMPEITVDAFGQGIQPDTSYKVKCGIKHDWNGAQYMMTEVKTPMIPYMCRSGVWLNDVEAPTVVMSGQQSLTISGTEWHSFPKSMDGMHAYQLPSPVPAGSKIEMVCCPGEECEFFFAIYTCAACTGPQPAGLVETLILDGWEAGPCAPQFDDNFKTIAYHKSFDVVDPEVRLSYTLGYNNILAMFGMPGRVAQPWCKKQHGPAAPGPGCGARCPTI
eukprot:TRINITY_DN533_c0_g1_i1.p1 TRINITY_DN533_c0_g1~~TRINITY_DN533_c0_g1_i1.p1  ORF type:complete len:286 (+),score=94.39 TRINITY_DN533_c0_g1_i1:60-917(+)